MIHAALASTKEYVKTRRDDTRRFLQAYLEGIKISRTDPEYTKQIIGKYTKTTDVADLENSYQTFLPAWERLPLVPAAAVQTMLNFASHPGAKTAKPEAFIDNSILAEIDKSGFVDKLYK
jgi:ABC-type nitrate/sulfonate/bicarbonate transport system substrate-binding protein